MSKISEKKGNEKIDPEKLNKINEYMSKWVITFERGLQKYESSFDEYGGLEYGDGCGFEEEEVWYDDKKDNKKFKELLVDPHYFQILKQD